MKYQVALVRLTVRPSRSRKAALERLIEKPSHPIHLPTIVAVVNLPVVIQVIVIVLPQNGLLLDSRPIIL